MDLEHSNGSSFLLFLSPIQLAVSLHLGCKHPPTAATPTKMASVLTDLNVKRKMDLLTVVERPALSSYYYFLPKFLRGKERAD